MKNFTLANKYKRSRELDRHMVWTYILVAICLGAAVMSYGGCASGWAYDYDVNKEAAIAAGKPAFGPDNWKVPPVFFHPGELTCADGHEGTAVNGWRVPSVTWCVSGTSTEGSAIYGPAHIEISPVFSSWANSALCHEMGHASRFMRGIDGDQAHTSETFAPGGTVEKCTELVASWELAREQGPQNDN